MLYQASLRGLLSDPRDAGLLRALEFLEPRLTELAEEFGEAPMPEGLIATALELLTSAKGVRLGLGAWPEVPTRESMPGAFFGELDFRATDPAAAGELVTRILRLLAPIAPPGSWPAVEGNPRLVQLDFGDPGAYLGVRPEADGSASVLAAWGDPSPSSIDLTDSGLPKGVEPRFLLRLDLGALRPVIEFELEAAGEEAELLREQLKAFGLLATDEQDANGAYRFELVSGYGGGALHYVTRQSNWVPLIQSTGGLVAEPLSPADLRLVPADATIATLAKVNLKATFTALRSGVPAGKNPLALLKTLLGVDLETALLDPLGTTFGAYLSETTGAGGLGSMILVLSVRDPGTLATTMEKLAAVTNALGESQADGYVALRTWTSGDAVCMTLGFPGLPVPLELSTGLLGGYLFGALTPTALIAALDHFRSGAAGLIAEPRFRDAALGSLTDLQGLTFSDTPRMIRDGYTTTALFYSALANGLRSHYGAARDPGILMPSYHALLQGSLPHVALSRIEGKDLVMRGRGDASVTANLAGLAGNPLLGALGIPLGLAAIVANKTETEQDETERAPASGVPEEF